VNEFTEEQSSHVVAARFADAPDTRLRAVLESLVHHLHDFVKDVELTSSEWAAAIRFLTETGHWSQGTRQEFILLSDVLGVSMLVETINNRTGGVATESTVLGPFHQVASPPRRLGDTIALDGRGEPCVVTGRVRDTDGKPVPGASVDVWQANDEGFYDVQRPDGLPALNLRGLFTADDDAEFWFRTIVPRFYPIPTDGPVGELLMATGRHPYRPAHIHFIVTADGYRGVTTHLFPAGTDYLDSDAVFGVKSSLVREFTFVDDAEQAAAYGVPNPFRTVDFEVVLAPPQPAAMLGQAPLPPDGPAPAAGRPAGAGSP
jgi:hydroxyquinol 1,2-dioxygenase